MFSCLKYRDSNKVLPIPTVPTATSPNLLEQIFKFNELNKTAIICMEGVGTNSPSSCKFLLPKGAQPKHVYYEDVPYFTRGYLKDVKTLYTDAGSLQNLGMIPHTLYSHERVFLLKECIKKYVTNLNIHHVIVVGISHGSLLVHGAFLKLQMDMEITLDHIKKIKIYTIGSPRYLPKGLIPGGDDKSLLNFYHVRDPYPVLLRKISGNDGRFQVPDLSSIQKNLPKKDPSGIHAKPQTTENEYLYDESNALVYVNRCKFVTSGVSKLDPDVFEHTYMPLFYEPLKQRFMFLENACLYHGSPYILYPIMDFDTRFHLVNTQRLTDNSATPTPIFATCLAPAQAAWAPSPPFGEGGSRSKIRYNKKTYSIHSDRKGKYIISKKQKVYLKTIKGQYRYAKS